MGYLIASFKEGIILEPKIHKNYRIKRAIDLSSVIENVEIVPLGFSELIPISLFYPIIFKSLNSKEIAPYAVISLRKKNFYLSKENSWKIDIFPQICTFYPFGLYKKNGEFLIAVDKRSLIPFYKATKEEDLIFDEYGNESLLLQNVKRELTYFIKDFLEAQEFANELFKEGCLKKANISVNTIWGEVKFNDVFLGDIEGLYRMQPEKLYYFNHKGYLPLLYGIFFSIRNFDLMQLMAKEIVITQPQSDVYSFSQEYNFKIEKTSELI